MKSLLLVCFTLVLVACGNKQEAAVAAPVAASAPAPAVAPATQQK